MILQVDNTWPTSLPLPKIEFSGNPRNATITSPTESAAISRRSRFDRSYSTLSVTWCFTGDQIQIFDAFFSDDLGNGTAQFKIELRFPETSSLTEWSVRFQGGYQREYDGGHYYVKSILELIERVPGFLPGVVVNWEALEITGLADDDQVVVWPDTSQFSRSAIQTIDDAKPLYKEGSFGVAPGVQFDGVDDFLSFNPASLTSWTMFIAWKLITWAEFSCPLSWRASGKAGFLFVDGVGNPSHWAPNLVATDATNTVILSRYGAGFYFAPEKAIHMHRFGDASYAWSKNGSTPALYTLDGYTIGPGGVGGPWPSLAQIGHGYEFCNCLIGAIRVYNYALSNSEVAVVVDELNSKYPCF